MGTSIARQFEDKPACREKTPLLIGLVSPSGAGKTYSALRLATGIQRVSGGDIHVIDTEARRALHYAPKRGEKANPAAGTFDFQHLSFGAPFSPLDYLAAIEHCVKKGAKTIIIDSCSHEHEGPGGVLEMHEAELERMCGSNWQKREAMNMLAWSKPKAMRRRLINAMLQIDCNFILNFRAKEKLKMEKGKPPVQMGWQPIAGGEFVFEMALKCLFLPGGNGVPVLQSDYEGERAMIKIPTQFRGMFDPQNPKQMSEGLGEELARWAAGSAAPDLPTVAELFASFTACHDAATFRTLESQRASIWGKATKEQRAQLKTASDAAKLRAEEAPRFDEQTGEFIDGSGETDDPEPTGREPGEDG